MSEKKRRPRAPTGLPKQPELAPANSDTPNQDPFLEQLAWALEALEFQSEMRGYRALASLIELAREEVAGEISKAQDQLEKPSTSS